MLKLLRRKGQSSLEYASFIIIVLAVMLSAQMYFKRGIQGRMKASADGIGEQYDPMTTEADITQSVSGNTITTVLVQNATGGKETMRSDNAIMAESKNGFSRVNAY